MNSQTNLLNSLYQNASMGQTSLKKVIKEVKDTGLKTELKKQLNTYKQQASTITQQMIAMNEKPTDISGFSKTMATTGIKLNCIKDSSTQHIAEIMIKGTNMGIISINKALNAASDASPKIIQEATKLLTDEQKYLDNLKAYL